MKEEDIKSDIRVLEFQNKLLYKEVESLRDYIYKLYEMYDELNSKIDKLDKNLLDERQARAKVNRHHWQRMWDMEDRFNKNIEELKNEKIK